MENLLAYVTFLKLSRRIHSRLMCSNDGQACIELPHCGSRDATNKENSTPT